MALLAVALWLAAATAAGAAEMPFAIRLEIRPAVQVESAQAVAAEAPADAAGAPAVSFAGDTASTVQHLPPAADPLAGRTGSAAAYATVLIQ